MPSRSGTDFTQGSIMRHVTVMSFTASIGIMAIYVVDLLDIFFVSLLGQAEVAAAARSPLAARAGLLAPFRRRTALGR